MKVIILVVSLAAIASAIPRPDRPVGIPSLIPEQFRRAISNPEENLVPKTEELNFDDTFAPNAISINFVEIPPQQALQDFIELVKVAQHAFEAHSEEIKIAPFPFYQANIEQIPAVENQLPSDDFVADKVVVVDNEVPQADKVQVVNTLPKQDGAVEENIEKEMEKVKIAHIPIQDEQNEVIRVASIPIQNSEVSVDNDKVLAVKFVETPNVDGNAGYIGVPAPIAPSELESLRVDFNENPAPISLSDAKNPQPFYPNNLYDDPMLR